MNKLFNGLITRYQAIESLPIAMMKACF